MSEEMVDPKTAERTARRLELAKAVAEEAQRTAANIGRLVRAAEKAAITAESDLQKGEGTSADVDKAIRAEKKARLIHEDAMREAARKTAAVKQLVALQTAAGKSAETNRDL
jgi:hypothetical protein